MNHSFNRSTLVVALVSVGFALGAQAQNAPSGAKENPPGTAAQQGATRPVAERGTLAPADRRFAERAAEAGMAEVEAGKLAQQKAQDPQVKQFGERMVHDHSQANDRLKEIASKKGIELPTRLDKKAQKELDKFEKASADDFDRTYIKAQLADHKKAIALFKDEQKSGKDADLRKFASDTLPTLEEHLKQAQSAQQDVMSKSASSKSGPSKS